MSGRANFAVRRRWGVCAKYARRQEREAPRRFREERRTKTQDGSTHSYLALGGGDGSRGLEREIVELLVGSPEPLRRFPLAALTSALGPIRPQEFATALRQLEQQGILIRRGEDCRLSRPIRRLVKLGLFSDV